MTGLLPEQGQSPAHYPEPRSLHTNRPTFAANALDEAGQHAARRMLPRLVRINDETVDTGRPADRSVLLDGQPDPEAAERALGALAEARLLVLDEHTVRISHDALLRGWPLLSQWIAEDRDWLRVRQQIAADADAWWQASRDPSLLYRGSRLEAARTSAARASDNAIAAAGPVVDPRLADFLDESWRQERRGVRVRRAAIAVLAVLAVLAASGGITAAVFQRQAVAQRNQAVARLVATEADSLRDSQPGLAKQLSVIAYRMDPGAGTATLFAGLESPGTFDANEHVIDIAVGHDGRTLALSTGDAVVLWDTTDRALARINLPGSRSVALSPDTRLLAATTSTGTVRLWDIHDRSHPRALAVPSAGSGGGIASLAFSPDGEVLAVGTATGTLQLWNVTAAEPDAVRPWRTLTGPRARVDSVAFAPSGHLLAAAAADGQIRLWQPDDPRTTPLATVVGAPLDQSLAGQPLHRITFSPDGHLLVGPGDGSKSDARLWSVTDPARPTLLHADAASQYGSQDAQCAITSSMVSAAFSPNGTSLATVCGQNLLLWELEKAPFHLRYVNKEPAPALPHGDNSGPAVFTPHGYQLLQVGGQGAQLWYASDTPKFGALATLGTHPSGFQITTVFSGGPRRLFVVQGADYGMLWDLTNLSAMRPLADLPGSGMPGAEGAAFSPDGRILAISEDVSNSQVLRLVDTSHPRARPIATINAELNDGVDDVQFSPDGRTLAVADNNDYRPAVTTPPSVKLFDVGNPAHPRLIATLRGDVFHVRFSPDGRLLTANTADTLLLWDVSDPRHPVAEPTRGLTSGTGVSEAAFRPDGRLLAVIDSGGMTRLWRVDHDRLAGDPVIVRTGSSGTGIAFTPDGRTLALTSNGSLQTTTGETKSHIELWDVNSPDSPQLQAAFAYDDSVGSSGLSYSTQGPGPPLLAAMGDTAVDVLDTDSAFLLKALCASIGDPITRPQWSHLVPDTPYHPPCGSSTQ